MEREGLVDNGFPGLPPILAAPTQHPRRRKIVAMLAAHLAVLLATALVVSWVHASAANPATRSPVAALAAGAGAGAGDVDNAQALFSPDGTTLATNYNDSQIQLWSTRSGRRIATVSVPGPGVPSSASGSHFAFRPSFAFSPDGRTVAVATGNSNRTYLLTVPAGHVIATFANPDVGTCPSLAPGASSVAFSPDGASLAVGDHNGCTYLWSLRTGRLIATLAAVYPRTATDPTVAAVAFSPRGDTLATGDTDGRTSLWNTATGRLTATLTDPVHRPGGGVVQAIGFSPDGSTLAAGDEDGQTFLWDTATGRLTATLSDPGSAATADVRSVAFSPDGTVLAAGDMAAGQAYLWDTATGRLIAALAPTGQGVSSVAFSPAGVTLAVATPANFTTYLYRPNAASVWGHS